MAGILSKAAGLLGDVAKATFNGIPLVPNIPASKFQNEKLGDVATKIGTATNIAKGAVIAVAAPVALPGMAAALKPAASIVKTVVPSTGTVGAAPTSVPTNGFVQNTLSGATKQASSFLPQIVSKAIGISQNSAAPVTSVGNQVHIPVNTNGVGISASSANPNPVTNTGFVSGDTGILAKATGSLLDLAGNLFLPAPSNTAEKIKEVVSTVVDEKNKPTNPTTPDKTDMSGGSMGWILGAVILVGTILALIFGRRR